MFPELFGGGNARLVMTGDEILDAGVQVMAQPPGKKNQTIHLLSGGEKALTAIALVFAIFQLNPAPFCLLDEVDAPLDDANTERYAKLVTSMSRETQFLFISHNKIAMEMAEQLIGVTMQEQGVSRIVAVDMEAAVSHGRSGMSRSARRCSADRALVPSLGGLVLAARGRRTTPGCRAATRRASPTRRTRGAPKRRADAAATASRSCTTSAGAGDERHEPLFDADLPAPQRRRPRRSRQARRPRPADRRHRAARRSTAWSRGDAALAALPRDAPRRQQAVRDRRPATSTRGEWEPPRAGQRYGEFQAGVQLANRTGALNEIEYSEFVIKAQAFADAVNGAPEFPDMLDEVARAPRARPVRQRARRPAGLHAARPHAAWSPGYVQQNAARLGFVAGHHPGPHGAAGRRAGLPPMLGLSFDTQAALADDPAQSAIRELDAEPRRAAGRPRASSPSCACARRAAALARDHGRRRHRRRRPAAARRDAWTSSAPTSSSSTTRSKRATWRPARALARRLFS